MQKIADDYSTMQKLVTKGEEQRQELEKRKEKLELCLAAREVKISEDRDLKTKVQVSKAWIAKLEGGVS